MSRTFNNFDIKMSSDEKNSTGFYILLTFLTIVTGWSRSTSTFYVLIGQNLIGEFMRKTYAASGNLFTDS